eukprot:scaffold9329_cov51-Attheya_sp.AAC.3
MSCCPWSCDGFQIVLKTKQLLTTAPQQFGLPEEVSKLNVSFLSETSVIYERGWNSLKIR